MRDLRLNLKKEWYDLIESGVKKEEYREIKPYWLTRLTTVSTNKERVCNRFINDPYYDDVYFKQYDTITFVYGYTKRQMTFKFEGVAIKEGNPEWGAVPGQLYFVIKIGDKIL